MNQKRPSPRLAIGLPVRNGARFLAAALDTLLGQSFADFEVLVADNASTDATADIAAEYARRDARVRYHRHRENIGASGNFNFCFTATHGELFKWAACDDRLAPTFLERCIEVLDTRPEVVLAATRAVEIDSQGTLGQPYEFALSTDDPRPSVRFRELVVVRHPCTLVFGVARREALAETALISNYVSADRVLLAELALRGRIVEVGDPLFERRVHEDNSIMLDKRSTLLAWYDPRLGGTISLPSWRLVQELIRAANAAPITWVERVRCYRAVAAHAHFRRSDLSLDLNFAVRKILARSDRWRALAASIRGTGHRAD